MGLSRSLFSGHAYVMNGKFRKSAFSEWTCKAFILCLGIVTRILRLESAAPLNVNQAIEGKDVVHQYSRQSRVTLATLLAPVVLVTL